MGKRTNVPENQKEFTKQEDTVKLIPKTENIQDATNYQPGITSHNLFEHIKCSTFDHLGIWGRIILCFFT